MLLAGGGEETLALRFAGISHTMLQRVDHLLCIAQYVNFGGKDRNIQNLSLVVCLYLKKDRENSCE